MSRMILRWDRRFRLSSGARPGPHLSRRYQSRGHRIFLNISSCAAESLVPANPVVPRFILPEALTRSPDQAIRIASSGSLQPAHDRSDFHFRRNQNVNVVRHDHPRVKPVKPAPMLAVFDCVGNQAGYRGISQPKGTARFFLQLSIPGYESVSRSRIGFQNLLTTRRGKRPVQSPGYKQSCAGRLQVRQIPSILSHFFSRQAEAPVPPLSSVLGSENSQADSRAVAL